LGLARILRFKPKSNSPAGEDRSQPLRKLAEICRELLLDSDGISGASRAMEAVRLYESLDKPNRIGFFDLLLGEFSPSPEVVGRAADDYRQNPSPANLKRLQHVVEPPRQELFRRLNMATGGTRTLIEMRALALAELDAHKEFEPIAADLGHLFASWFNSGFLTLQQIDWRSPAVILEKLIAYEAVHQIQGWTDLRRRLEADRRCYGFFHSALPNEPLIFIEVALTRGMSENIHPLIDPDAAVGDPGSADSAIFYSITNCQPGLRGVPLGSSLIKRVVEDLRKSLPGLKTFATLSPIPGFRKWLMRERNNAGSPLADVLAEPETQSVMTLLESQQPSETEWTPEQRQRLIALCAWYLLHVKRDAEPLDPVARFHLRNGARIDRINWMGDPSATGIRQSAGIMANYVYELDDLQRNHELYTAGKICSSSRMERLPKQLNRNKNPNWLSRHFL